MMNVTDEISASDLVLGVHVDLGLSSSELNYLEMDPLEQNWRELAVRYNFTKYQFRFAYCWMRLLEIRVFTVSVKFLTFKSLIIAKTMIKVIGNWFCSPIIFGYLINMKYKRFCCVCLNNNRIFPFRKIGYNRIIKVCYYTKYIGCLIHIILHLLLQENLKKWIIYHLIWHEM